MKIHELGKEELRRGITFAFLIGLLFLALAHADPPWKRPPSLELSAVGSPSTPPYSVVARTNYSAAARVEFWVDGKLKTTEKVPPYCLFADNGSTPYPGSLGAGLHAIRVKLFALNGGPQLAEALMTLLESAPVTATPKPTATATPAPLPTPAPTASPSASVPGGTPATTGGTPALQLTPTPTPAMVFPDTWTDRRPIGQVILATTVNIADLSNAFRYATNPRGWFNDPTLNLVNADKTLNPAGLATFQTRLLDRAKTAVANIQSLGGQGMVTWDVEGEWFFQPITYIGDPRLAETLAPEMATLVTYGGRQIPVIDAYFQIFRDAGLKTGVCLRHQQLRTADNYTSLGGYPNHTWQAGDATMYPDPTRTAGDKIAALIAKANYAHNRWGCTLFYVDSNDWSEAAIFEAAAKACPWALFCPENTGGDLARWARTAACFHMQWYDGYCGVESSVLAMVPQAFNVIQINETRWGGGVNDPAFLTNHWSQIVESIKGGHLVPLVPSWWADPIIPRVKQLLIEAGK